MKICFPVYENKGLNSNVYNHFGSAPFYLIVNTDTMETVSLSNQDQDHSHGACNPLKALNGNNVDAIAVGGIGGGALQKLNQIGIKVYKVITSTIHDNIVLLKENALPEFTPQHVCSGHGYSCSH